MYESMTQLQQSNEEVFDNFNRIALKKAEDYSEYKDSFQARRQSANTFYAGFNLRHSHSNANEFDMLAEPEKDNRRDVSGMQSNWSHSLANLPAAEGRPSTSNAGNVGVKRVIQYLKQKQKSEKRAHEIQLDEQLRRDHYEKVKKIILDSEKGKHGDKFGPATSYRRTVIRPIAQSWWSAQKVKSLSSRLYLDKLKSNLKEGDSDYIKNAMLLKQTA